MNDISICINKNDCMREKLINDLNPSRYGLEAVECLVGTEDEYTAYEGFVSDEDLESILLLRDMSPYGNGYDIMKWVDGNSIDL